MPMTLIEELYRIICPVPDSRIRRVGEIMIKLESFFDARVF